MVVVVVLLLLLLLLCLGKTAKVPRPSRQSGLEAQMGLLQCAVASVQSRNGAAHDHLRTHRDEMVAYGITAARHAGQEEGRGGAVHGRGSLSGSSCCIAVAVEKVDQQDLGARVDHSQESVDLGLCAQCAGLASGGARNHESAAPVSYRQSPQIQGGSARPSAYQAEWSRASLDVFGQQGLRRSAAAIGEAHPQGAMFHNS